MGDYDISHYVEVQIDALQEQINLLDARVLVLEETPQGHPPGGGKPPVEEEEVTQYGQ